MLKVLMIALVVFVLTSGYTQAQTPADMLRELRGQPSEAQEEALRQQHLNRYEQAQVHKDGTVTFHGVQWMRCSIGQEWKAEPMSPTDGTCSGVPVASTWSEAFELTRMINNAGGFAGHTDWRLPNIMELQMLRLCSSGRTREETVLPDGTVTFAVCDGEYKKPSIDSRVFPNTRGSRFWSGSPRANDSSHAWVVRFSDGSAYSPSRSGSSHVRLVRGGQ